MSEPSEEKLDKSGDSSVEETTPRKSSQEWDPNAKPEKSILKKEGSVKKDKTNEHIQLDTTEGKDAEKRKSKTPMPVEGVKGIVMKGKGGQQLNKKPVEKETTSNTSEEEEPEETTRQKEKKKSSGQSEKNKENCIIS